MVKNEKIFTKYKSKGADYHWRQINKRNIFDFNAHRIGSYQIMCERILKFTKIHTTSPELRIIDFGCGDGVLLFMLKRELEKDGKNVSVFGVDSSPESIAVAQKKNPGGIFRCNSVYSAGFQDDIFDIAVSSDVIEHVDDPNKMIDEMIRVTKKAGFIAISTPVKFSETPLDNLHFQEFFPGEFSRLFETKDLKTVDYIQSHPLFYTLLYGRPINLFVKKIKIFKYLLNILAGYFGNNVFLQTRPQSKNDLMSYQSIFLKK